MFYFKKKKKMPRKSKSPKRRLHPCLRAWSQSVKQYKRSRGMSPKTFTIHKKGSKSYKAIKRIYDRKNCKSK